MFYCKEQEEAVFPAGKNFRCGQSFEENEFS